MPQCRLDKQASDILKYTKSNIDFKSIFVKYKENWRVQLCLRFRLPTAFDKSDDDWIVSLV